MISIGMLIGALGFIPKNLSSFLDQLNIHTQKTPEHLTT